MRNTTRSGAHRPLRPTLRLALVLLLFTVAAVGVIVSGSVRAAQPERAAQPAQDAAAALAQRADGMRDAGDASLALSLYLASLSLRDDAQVRERMTQLAQTLHPPDPAASSLDLTLRLRNEMQRREELERRVEDLQRSLSDAGGVERRLEHIERELDDDSKAESLVDRLEREVIDLNRSVDRLERDVTRLEREVERIKSRIR